MQFTMKAFTARAFSTFKYMSAITTCTVFVVFFSILIQAYISSMHLSRLTTILTGLIGLETSIVKQLREPIPIAVGYGACSDLYVDAIKVLDQRDDVPTINPSIYSIDDISNENELLMSFNYYFQMGAAAERYASNQQLFKHLIKKTESLEPNSYRWDLGGNAPVMASRFAKEGANVLLAARMSTKLRTYLHPNVNLVGDPVTDDDVHLILEYRTNDKWGEHIAPRANRYILHNDKNNPTLSSLETLDEALMTFNPRLFVVSGIQMMDSYPFPEGVREARLSKVRDQIKQLPSKTLVHFEMASYVELKLLQLLLQHVIPYSDSLGMNEQELFNLQQVMEVGKVSFVADSNPRVATALNQLRAVFKFVNRDYFKNSMKEPSRRMVTRIHVHTLAYQAILVVKNSDWHNTKNAAAKAALTAHRHVCGTDIINPESSNLILDDSFSTSTDLDELIDAPQRVKLDPYDPVSCWNETIRVTKMNLLEVEICLSPVLVCKVAKQTAGAGDNISASGLILQIV